MLPMIQDQPDIQDSLMVLHIVPVKERVVQPNIRNLSGWDIAKTA